MGGQVGEGRTEDGVLGTEAADGEGQGDHCEDPARRMGAATKDQGGDGRIGRGEERVGEEELRVDLEIEFCGGTGGQECTHAAAEEQCPREDPHPGADPAAPRGGLRLHLRIHVAATLSLIVARLWTGRSPGAQGHVSRARRTPVPKGHRGPRHACPGGTQML